MNTKNMTQEKISAFADGELADGQVDMMLAALNSPDGRAAWATYHEIGDTIRSDDLDFEFSPDFMTRMSARLDAEPAIVAPVFKYQELSSTLMQDEVPVTNRKSFKRFAMPTLTLAATLAAIGFATAPQLMVASKDSGRASTTAVASADQSNTNGIRNVSMTSQKEIVMRDPRIDEYLLAHQRFSPSVYSTAQYARSASFATDTDK